jgi:[ribosomal protein S5]-alanine N-acetyltransferase
MLPDAFETARILLRPVTIMDVDAIFGSYAQDEEVVRYLIWRPHRSRSETQAYVERCTATPSEVERTYMLVGRGGNVVRGALALRQRPPHRLDCGYVLARPWWRQGLMTEILTEVAVWALRQPSVFRIGAVCAISRTSVRSVCSRNPVSYERACCVDGCCTRTSATNRETALAMPAYVEDHRSEPICPAG